jgi:membrane-bound lytic murein transglycosylase D
MNLKRHKITAVCLVAILAIGLHLTFRSLASEIPKIFPQIARESMQQEAPPAALSDLIQDEVMVKPETPLPPPELSRTPAPKLPPARLVEAAPLPIPSVIKRPVTTSFNVPSLLQPAVEFWKKIYAVYNTDQVVFHDTENLSIQYSVLDFSKVEADSISDAEKKQIRDAAVRRETDRIRTALEEISSSSSFASLSKDAKRIAPLFDNVDEPKKFQRAEERIRAQTGLKNRFQEGIVNSGKYLPIFEKIFEGYGIPKQVTRLAFVESIFKERSYSKVGAAGLWQFMPGTAKNYITVNRLVDQRYDPIASTHAAAKLLRKNYELLGTWPLAINAYNSGTGNLLKAINKLGTKDISRIIVNYRSGSYSFASRNFYPSFLAALSVYENSEAYFGPLKKEDLLQFDLVRLPATLSFPDIASLSGISLEELRALNPAFVGAVFEGGYALPAGAQVRLPQGKENVFAARFIERNPGTIQAPLQIVKSGPLRTP